MIILRPRELTWINGEVDDPFDLCAHGKVQFEIDGVSLVRVEEGEWTVSAAALFLLRALRKDHTEAAPLFENVIPCCGHAIYANDDSEDVEIVGCPNGINFQIIHIRDTVQIVMDDKRQLRVPTHDWRAAVLGFSQAVREFYSASAPKTPVDASDRKGFCAFMVEWNKRHEEARRG